VQKSLHDLAAARYDLGSIKNQTAAAVTTLYCTALLDYHQPTLYRDSLIPSPGKGTRSLSLAISLESSISRSCRIVISSSMPLQISQLQFENQYFAQKVALEQTIGAPLSQ